MFFFATPGLHAKSKVKSVAPASISLKDVPMSGLSFRSIGPAVTGGRIAVLAVNSQNPSTYYVGSGHGNLWKTENRGMTFTPVFDNQKAYAIGALALDPTNPNVLWVGTGENNCQANSGYGDGVYKTCDGGKTWKNVGLKDSEHIGGIVIDPGNPNTVYVAAYGSQRRSGGDRGIYKTTDGGTTWKRILFVSRYTGFFQIKMDPRFPGTLYASAHQRMRKHYTSVYGGPESGLYRSTDAGKTWQKLTQGLPKGDMGRIGIAISPASPDTVYAIINAIDKEKGFYKSTDRGMSWTKQSGYVSSYPFYFQQLIADPIVPDRVYSVDVFMQVTQDGGKTWKNAGSDKKHVDDHCLWINPRDNKHLIAGCDGGVYESYDRAKSWSFRSTLPIAEIYKITTDRAKPFYNVYIGTQDNNSLTGPSRTISSGGITNQDWIFTNSGDGFETQVDWTDSDIIYAQSQYGGLVRFDRKTGENLFIKPQDFAGEAYRFDWDAALLISSHDPKVLYFGGNKVLKTEDRGSTWREISPDLTCGVPRELEPLMGQSWSIDQIVRKGSLANIVTIAESPLNPDKLFAGSADGLIHTTDDGGTSWHKAAIEGLPEYTRIHHLIASHFDQNVAYAACQDLIGGNYHPFLYKTIDGGKTWSSMNGDLPERGCTYTIAEDHVDKNLMFVGTQAGVFFTVNGGTNWAPLKSGIPAHCVMDLEIQAEHNDLVVSTFGRGVYILDDYTPLRHLSTETLEKEAVLFPVRTAEMFIPSNPFGFRGTGFMGADFFSAPNPEVGAVFRYYLKSEMKTLKEKRREKEKKLQKEGKSVKHPAYEELRAEADEPDSYLIFEISDKAGNVIRHLRTKAKKGIQSVVWDFRYDPVVPVSLSAFDSSIPWNEPDRGYMVMPGDYKVTLFKVENGTFTELAPGVSFSCKPLNHNGISDSDKQELDVFNRNVAELTRVIRGADQYRTHLVKNMAYLKKAMGLTPGLPREAFKKRLAIEATLRELNRSLNGDALIARYKGASPTSVRERVDLITGALWNTTSAPTSTFRKSFETASESVDSILKSLQAVDKDIKSFENLLEESGAPWTPGRIPVRHSK